MKKIVCFLLLLAGSNLALANNPNKTENDLPAKSKSIKSGVCSLVTAEDVIDYLRATDPAHTVLNYPTTRDCGYTWKCLTHLPDGHTYSTTVYCDEANIIGFEDTAID